MQTVAHFLIYSQNMDSGYYLINHQLKINKITGITGTHLHNGGSQVLWYCFSPNGIKIYSMNLREYLHVKYWM